MKIIYNVMYINIYSLNGKVVIVNVNVYGTDNQVPEKKGNYTNYKLSFRLKTNIFQATYLCYYL